MMFKFRQRSGLGPAADKLLGYTGSKPIRISPKQQVLLDKQAMEAEAEYDAQLTPKDRELMARLDREAAFEKKYVLRSNAEHDVRTAASAARGDLITYLLILVIIPLVALVIAFRAQANTRIDCSKLSRDSIQYLEQGGESLPLDCTIGR